VAWRAASRAECVHGGSRLRAVRRRSTFRSCSPRSEAARWKARRRRPESPPTRSHQLVSRVLFRGPRSPQSAWRSFVWDVRCRTPRAAYPGARAGSPRAPLYVALLQVGFAVPQPLPVARWALTPPFHPYSRHTGWLERSIFCGTFLEVALTGCYPAPCPVEPGLSSQPESG